MQPRFRKGDRVKIGQTGQMATVLESRVIKVNKADMGLSKDIEVEQVRIIKDGEEIFFAGYYWLADDLMRMNRPASGNYRTLEEEEEKDFGDWGE